MDMVDITERFLKDPRTRNKVLLICLGCLFLCCLVYVGLSINWSAKKPLPTRLPTPGTDLKSMMGKTNNILKLVVNGISWYELKEDSCDQLTSDGGVDDNKIVVAEVAFRNRWTSTVEITEFAFVDSQGKVIKAKKVFDYQVKQKSCLPKISVPYDTGDQIDPEYGAHFYLVSDSIPSNTTGLQLAFNVKWLMEYYDVFSITGTPEIVRNPTATPTPKLVETATGVTRYFLSLGNKPTTYSPDKKVLGYPNDEKVDTGYSIADNLKLALGEIAAVPAEKTDFGATDQEYYANLIFTNSGKKTTSGIYQFVKLFVVDTFGVKLPCKFESDSDFGNTMAPDESQMYYCTFGVEEKSVDAGPLIIQYENGQDTSYEKKYIAMSGFTLAQPTPAVTAAAVATTQTASECSTASTPHLIIGKRGYVTFSPPLPNRIREEPGLKGKYITSYKPGVILDIIEGPKCSDNMYWWKVTNKSTGVTGWTSEGGEGKYWIENCQSDKTCYK